jgi:hypothetical protein
MIDEGDIFVFGAFELEVLPSKGLGEFQIKNVFHPKIKMPSFE